MIFFVMPWLMALVKAVRRVNSGFQVFPGCFSRDGAIRAQDKVLRGGGQRFGSGLAGGGLGFEDGEELWPGVTIQVDGKATGNFRVICGLNHGEQPAREAHVERPVTHAVGQEA